MISPNGTSVAYTLNKKLWVQDLDQMEPREITTDGDVDKPFWSPDGNHIGYLSNGKVFKVPAAGGTSVKMSDPQPSFSGGRGATWGEDGRIVFSYGTEGLQVISEQGGDPKLFYDLVPEQDADYHEPSWLPGGRGVLFVSHGINTSPDTVELIAGDKRVKIVRVEGQRLFNPQYCSSGHVIYRRAGQNGGVWAVPFSIDKLEVTGEPFLVAADSSYPSIAKDGTMVYLRGASDSEFVLRWTDRNGAVGDSVTTRSSAFGQPSLSPDESRLAVVSNDGDEIDIWIHDMSRGTRTRFTFAEGSQVAPAWSPDGTEIFFHNIPTDSIYVRAADGTGSEHALVKGRSPSVSRDGTMLAYHFQGGKTQEDIWYTPLEGGVQPVAFLVTPARELNPKISPDGRYLVYESNESGDYEVYVKRFPSGEGKWQVSIDGGEFPVWGRSGNTLYYRGGGCDIYEVPVQTESNLVLGTPVKVVDCNSLDLVGGNFRTYAVSGDGEAFIMQQPVVQHRNTFDVGITVVQNWAREFQGRSND